MTQGRTDRPKPNPQRVTIREAAYALGISEGAVRMRIKRGTLRSTHEAGRLYVLLDTDPTTDLHRPHDRDNDRTDELIRTLREQLEAERQAHAESRRLLAAALERIPAIEAPPEARESPEGSAAEPERAEPRTDAEETQEGTERRSWWRRVFGAGM